MDNHNPIHLGIGQNSENFLADESYTYKDQKQKPKHQNKVPSLQ